MQGVLMNVGYLYLPVNLGADPTPWQAKMCIQACRKLGNPGIRVRRSVRAKGIFLCHVLELTDSCFCEI
jgi:hypothetical protein